MWLNTNKCKFQDQSELLVRQFKNASNFYFALHQIINDLPGVELISEFGTILQLLSSLNFCLLRFLAKISADWQIRHPREMEEQVLCCLSILLL